MTLARRPPAAQSRPLSWGILSTARINGPVLAAARSTPSAAVVAVASRDPARASGYAREHSIERAYGSYEELLSDPEVDAVYVSLPNALHRDWSIRALEGGKHVLCEKPLARRESDAEGMFDAAERAGRVLREAFMYRHHPQTERVVELVRGGALGRLVSIRAAFSFTLPDAETDPRWSAELEGGALMDLGCYCVSVARLLAGEPVAALGEQRLAPSGVDVSFAGMLRFASGVVATLEASFDAPERSVVEVVGSDGVLTLEDPWHCRAPAFRISRPLSVEEVPVPAADSYRVQFERFARAVEGAAEAPFGRDDAVAQARTIEALYAAAERQERIDLTRG